MSRTRPLLRWSHILFGLYIGAVLWSPLIDSPAAVALARVLAIALLATGLLMWQFPRLRSALAHRDPMP